MALEEDGGLGITLESRVYSAYNYNGITYHAKPVLQTELAWEHESGFFASIWHSSGFNQDLSNGYDDEIDYVAGYSGEVFGYAYEVGTGYYDYASLGNQAGDSFYLYAKISKELLAAGAFTLSSYTTFECFIPATRDSEGGTAFRSGFEVCYELTDTVMIESAVETLHDGGVDGTDAGWLLMGHVCVSYAVTDAIALKCGAEYSVPISSFNDRDADLVGFVGISVSF